MTSNGGKRPKGKPGYPNWRADCQSYGHQFFECSCFQPEPTKKEEKK